MEELYKNKKIKAECKPRENFVEHRERIFEPIFMKVLHDFDMLCNVDMLRLEDTLWEGCCTTCASVEIILFEITHKEKIWLNVVRGFFVSSIMKLGPFNEIL